MANRTDVALCVMPFCPTIAPNLGLSLLKSGLEKNGFSVTISYFNLKLFQWLGKQVYDRVSGEDNNLELLTGEWLFSDFLFNKSSDFQSIGKQFLRNTKHLGKIDGKIIDEIRRVKKLIPKFINECTNEIIDLEPRLVGFSTSYYQNCSSLSLAKRIKEKMNVPIIFGGANCDQEMGYTLLQSFPQIDYVCSGDGDIAFIEFVKCLFGNISSKINGIITRDASELDVHLSSPVLNMDELPIPDFDDYFKMIERGSGKTETDIKINLETSRGCWWGESSHCTFCGLNGSTMMYRSKSPERVINEVVSIMERYKIESFQFVDNILDPKYFHDFFPRLREKMNVWMFYETKAPLTKPQLEIMKNAGVAAIQPGIESLSDAVLQIMKKGTTALQNIFVLKLCREIGMWVYWNIITGFPGEPEEDYRVMSEIVKLITHLEPPENFGKFQLSRFSPYFQEPNRYGITNIRPLSLYSLIYPFEENILHKIAYFFDHDYSDGRQVTSYTVDLGRMIEEWKEQWKNQPPELNMAHTNETILIRDTRECATQELHMLRGLDAIIYDACYAPCNLQTISRRIQDRDPSIRHDDIIAVLDDLCKRKIVLNYNERYLSLAVPVK